MKLFLPSLFFILNITLSYSQGCSDAGFCTMGAMKPDQPYNKKIQLKLRSMEVSFYRGTTTLTPIVYVATADMNFSLGPKYTFQLKVPFQFVEGQLAKTSSLGDLSVCVTRNIYTSDRFDVNLSLGGKIPTNSSDKSTRGLPLPMYYQTSLGTYDVIAGVSVINRKWLFATGIQIPLNQNNNQFVWSAWDGDVEQAYVDRYTQSKNLNRGIDVMLRAERNFRLSRFNFSVGLLPIYRITSDEITNSIGNRTSKDVKGNEGNGLALSVIGTGGYNFNVRSGIKLLIGHKVVQREFSPDGLTREFVSSVTYMYRF
ncbi:MAG: hypothetical protein ACK5RG_14470 [Cyclobacteriaceae bacterium]|jgi:hypothetical protein|nr:hypothetical protein [Flammeovirgaceae bacterium]